MKRLRVPIPIPTHFFSFLSLCLSLSLSVLDFVCFRLVLPTVSYVVSCVVNDVIYYVSDLTLFFSFFFPVKVHICQLLRMCSCCNVKS